MPRAAARWQVERIAGHSRDGDEVENGIGQLLSILRRRCRRADQFANDDGRANQR